MPIDGDAGRPRTIQFLRIGFTRLPLDGLIAEIRRRAQDAHFSFIVTPNVDHVVKLFPKHPTAHTAAFQAAYDAAALRICDSRILRRLAVLAGEDMPVLPGSDLTSILMRSVFEKGDRIAVIGGRAHTIAVLEALFPGPEYLQHIPPMGVLDNEHAMAEIGAFVARVKPTVTLFAIGAPQSEIAAHRCRNTAGATGVGLCIGASIDFLTGDQKRAPVWMQNAGLEWFYRLMHDPVRLWRRYLVEGPRVFGLFFAMRFRSIR